MPTVTAASAESAPATETFSGDVNEGFAEFQAESRKSAAVETLPEVAPASEPEEPAAQEPAKPKQEPLTDEQKSEAKRANNEKRWERLLRENAEKDAEIARLKSGKAETAAPAPAQTKADKDAEPREDFDPSTGKPYEDFAKFVRDNAAYATKQVIRAEKETQRAESAQAQERTVAEGFMGKINGYAKDHQGFIGTEDEPGAFDTVRDELEDGLQEVSAAIVEHDSPAELIDYLGTHPEAFARITALRGNPTRALIELGRIIASEFDAPASAAPDKPERPRPPKPPSPVTARGHVPSGEAALDAAADANDFTAFQRTLRAREGRK